MLKFVKNVCLIADYLDCNCHLSSFFNAELYLYMPVFIINLIKQCTQYKTWKSVYETINVVYKQMKDDKLSVIII